MSARTGRAANIARNVFRPGYARVIAAKAMRRLDRNERRREEAVAWARPQAQTIAEWCVERDPVLWEEARTFGTELRARARDIAAESGVEIGGGGRAELLYFVTRLRRPRIVVETGVAFGYSSAAFLTALARNGDGGRLYSSDFPYFRDKDPEQLVGVLVPDELRSGWTLLLRGDRHNLPSILAAVTTVDLFHYDSDKSYAGRRHAMQAISARLADDAVVLMDDIQDNLFFRDLVSSQDRAYTVFGSSSAFVGALGLS